MTMKSRLEFVGGTPSTSLLTVEPQEIVVTAYHPNKSQLQALARAADLVADSMGTEEKSSARLVELLHARARAALAGSAEGKEVEHVERN
jgi:hypothetical protein